jgi:hypothetical protein
VPFSEKELGVGTGRKYGGLEISEAKRLRALEAKLKRLLEDAVSRSCSQPVFDAQLAEPIRYLAADARKGILIQHSRYAFPTGRAEQESGSHQIGIALRPLADLGK